MAICDRRGSRRRLPAAILSRAPKSPTRAVGVPSASAPMPLLPSASAAKKAASPMPAGATTPTAVMAQPLTLVPRSLDGAELLKKLGRLDEVVDLVRHLPRRV